jgi:hypothetical protein
MLKKFLEMENKNWQEKLKFSSSSRVYAILRNFFWNLFYLE